MPLGKRVREIGQWKVVPPDKLNPGLSHLVTYIDLHSADYIQLITFSMVADILWAVPGAFLDRSHVFSFHLDYQNAMILKACPSFISPLLKREQPGHTYRNYQCLARPFKPYLSFPYKNINRRSPTFMVKKVEPIKKTLCEPLKKNCSIIKPEVS